MIAQQLEPYFAARAADVVEHHLGEPLQFANTVRKAHRRMMYTASLTTGNLPMFVLAIFIAPRMRG